MNDQEYIRTHQPDEIIEYECYNGPTPCREVVCSATSKQTAAVLTGRSLKG